MPLINRKDLKYSYNWSTEPADKPRTETTSTSGTLSGVFRGEEGESVLSFINDYAESHGIDNKEQALKIEKMLYEKLKDKQMTVDDVREWLDKEIAKN